MQSTYCDEHDVNRLNEKQLLQANNKNNTYTHTYTRKTKHKRRDEETINPINHIKLTYQAKIDRKRALNEKFLVGNILLAPTHVQE